MLKKLYISLLFISNLAPSFTVHPSQPTKQEKVEEITTKNYSHDLLWQSLKVELCTYQQALDGFNYIKTNAASLIKNYKKQLKKSNLQIDNKSYKLLELIEKFKYITGYSTTISYYGRTSYEHPRFNTYKTAGAFCIGGVLCKGTEVTKLRLAIAKIIADEMTNPCLLTKKAKRAFSYLKKMIKKELAQPTAKEKNAVIGLLDSFSKTCGHLDFKHTQTRGFVVPYTYFTDLAKIVKAYQDKVHRANAPKV